MHKIQSHQRDMVKISQNKRNSMKALLQKGFGHREIAKKLQISKSSVSNFANSIGIASNPKKGRPKILSERDESFCFKQMISGRSSTAVGISKQLQSSFNISASPDTISRVLKKKGLKAAEKKKKPLLSEKNIKARLEYAKKHKDWTAEDWNRVIFSDETKINRFNSDGRSWYWSRDPSVLDARSVKPTVKHGGGGIMLWGCMTSQGVGFSCKIDSTMDQHLYKSILEDELMKTIEYYELEEEQVIFQHDNDPKHTAKSVKEWLSAQEFATMVWPAQSPDLNPIEHLWSHVKRKLNQFETPPKGINELWERVQRIWNEIDPNICSNLFESMPSRIEAVLKSKGKWTKY